MRSWALVALVGWTGGATELVAQRPMGPGARAPMRSMAAPGALLDVRIGQVLDRRFELDLSDEQFERLQALRVEARSALDPLRTELEAIREGVRDGSVERTDARERMRAAMEGVRDAHVPLRASFDEILRPEQRSRLERRGAVGRPAGAWRGARRGPGPRGARAPRARQGPGPRLSVDRSAGAGDRIR
jgi:Spy/CpxP family protein refolding chaperone